MKILWFDVETTGLDPRVNDIIQLGYQLEINNEIVTEGDLRFRPINLNEIEDKALEICGLTKEEIMEYPDSLEQYKVFIQDLNRFIDCYNTNDKAYPAGYNVGFDYQFLTELPKKLGEKYGIGSYLNHTMLDPLPIINNLIAFGAIEKPRSRRLKTICGLFDIELEAHDAFNDIQATRKLYYALMSKFTYDGIPHWI